MQHNVTCPHCDRTLHVGDDVLGRTIRCQYCSQSFEAVEEPGRPVPSREQYEREFTPRVDEEEDAARASPFRPGGKGDKIVGGLLLLCILALIAGGIVTVLGWQDRTIRSLGKETPKDISFAELARNGPGDNVHVTVHDFEFGENYIYEEKKGSWSRVWIPMFPPGERGEIKVLLKTFSVKNAGELQNRYGAITHVTGVITNSIHSLGSAEKNELVKAYPNANVDSVLVLQDDYSFPSTNAMQIKLIIGIGLLVVGVGSGIGSLVSYRAIKKRRR